MADLVFRGLGEFANFLEERVGVEESALALAAEMSADVMYEKAKKIYGDSSKLAPLAQATQDERVSLGYTPNDPLLRDGRLLRDSLEKAHVGAIGGIGSDEIIHYYHEHGYINAMSGASVPARPVFRLAFQESAPELEAIVKEVIQGVLGFGVFLRLK